MPESILPAIQTVGSIKPHTLILEMPTSTRGALEDSIAGGFDNNPIRIYAHELHHWFDIVGTVWGRSYLSQLFNAYDAVLAAQTEDEAYPQVLTLFDADREILFPSYYKYVIPGAPHGLEQPWSNGATVGFRIKPDGRRDEAHPIFFVAFSSQGRPIARQPLSVGALLELRALAAENAILEEHLSRLGEDERLVERTIRSRELAHQLYEPELTTYSAAAHFLARMSGVGATGAVFAYGASVADLCLNLRPQHVRKLRPPALMNPIAERHRQAFVDRLDRGYVFACLVAQLQEIGGAELSAEILEETLRRSELPDRAAIYADAQSVMRHSENEQIKSERLAMIEGALDKAGADLVEARMKGEGLITRSAWARLAAPVVMTQDLELFHCGRPTVSVPDAEWLEECRWTLDRSTRQALRAARGLDFAFTDYTY